MQNLSADIVCRHFSAKFNKQEIKKLYLNNIPSYDMIKLLLWEQKL